MCTCISVWWYPLSLVFVFVSLPWPFLFWCVVPNLQVQGHEGAKLDPLGLDAWRPAIPPPELDPKFHGFEAK